ncbi:phosphodiesterase [Plantactinospora endophytica]|uniref:phosphodiesterase n=1 Tax=Plantactinospora endophytica TaxID=673535 RepID=UPI001940F6A6|nr:phosphodiesterase [Plantactinospora endophytica]
MRATSRVARWRGGRTLHPRGLSFGGEVELSGPLADRLVGGPGRYAATLRLSRGVPTPDGWPDLMGLAVRLHGVDGPFDLLLSNTGRLPLLRHLPLPRLDFAGPYGSLLAYRIDGRRRYLLACADRPLGRSLTEVAEVAARNEARFTLLAAGVRDPWRVFGRITFGVRLPAEVDAALAFDPDGRRGSALRPRGVLQRLRVVSYAASQRGRGAAEDQTRLP